MSKYGHQLAVEVGHKLEQTSLCHQIPLQW